jgi:ATP-dependent RNA helicase SUPV3L1/SUV3
MAAFDSGGRVVAVLGPTNTGKTHLAVERMLGHATGMIGFPLRLLARENYDRVVRLKGRSQVALITGEERILPARPRWYVCTVESMPMDREVDFLAVDEVQMAADADRGHVFTDRLLHARGREETMFLGAETVRGLLRRLVPEAVVESRPRFSKLTYAGPRKLTRLPRRSAVVAFSAAEVYEIAELMRRQRGGAAVVLGALSPRARNAQVGMYQAGEVDHLVATDAIGMGLNMDIHHVAFARLNKFDGRVMRRLTAGELGQIAGRAGRYMRDGTFGTTESVGALDPELVEAIENHRFEPLRRLAWRNADLNFASLQALLASLEEAPPDPALWRKADAEDHLSLIALARRGEVAERARHPAALRLLWDVAQVPDFRKILSDTHIGLLARLYGHLSAPAGRLPVDWVAEQVARIDRVDGDIDTLTGRIAHIRSWTYISHRADWLDDAAHWQERALAIEDRLSDALHERLTQRFVDRRTAILVRRMDDDEKLVGAVRQNGEVLVEGEHVGRLDGFRFLPDASAEGEDARAILTAARRSLRDEIMRRVVALEAAPDRAFGLRGDGRVTWQGATIARLTAGEGLLSPLIAPRASELLDPDLRDRVRIRLARWIEAHLARAFHPVLRLGALALGGGGRGLAYQLKETLGSLPRFRVADQVRALGPAERSALAGAGLRIGLHAVYLPALLKPEALRLRRLLWSVHHDFDDPPPAPFDGVASAPLDTALPESFFATVGCVALGGRAIRVDRAEKLAEEARRLAGQGPFVATPLLAATVDCETEALGPVLCALGFRGRTEQDIETFSPSRSNRPSRSARPAKQDAGRNGPAMVEGGRAGSGPAVPKNGATAGAKAKHRPRPSRPAADPDSPFAVLRGMKFGR